ncbi:Uncharacterized protein C7M84_006624 [Penaeus vannamei]|uniref:Uncharacterized protein n=1 Tax=Penaeus vannamei TaxID=6689 RepID=A0A423TEQ5_PENVA|nr:Uncharacterized protein C7M84_006624 [Penaeus vannamei]
MAKRLDDVIPPGTGRWNLLHILSLSYCFSLTTYHTLGGAFLPPSGLHLPPARGRPRRSCRPKRLTAVHSAGDNTSEEAKPECSYFVLNSSSGQVEEEPCVEWDFDNSTFSSTVGTEFQLACGWEYLRSTYQSIYMFGVTIGAVQRGSGRQEWNPLGVESPRSGNPLGVESPRSGIPWSGIPLEWNPPGGVESPRSGIPWSGIPLEWNPLGVESPRSGIPLEWNPLGVESPRSGIPRSGIPLEEWNPPPEWNPLGEWNPLESPRSGIPLEWNPLGVESPWSGGGNPLEWNPLGVNPLGVESPRSGIPLWEWKIP